MAFVDIDIDAEAAKKALEDLEVDLRESSDSAAREIAEAAKKRAVTVLYRNGSIGTGEGIASLHVEKMDHRDYAVMGRRYLEFVDRGTMPHRPPLNYRLIAWAQRRGINPNDLANHIEEEGTMPNPWINRAFQPIVATARDRGAAVMKRQTRL